MLALEALAAAPVLAWRRLRGGREACWETLGERLAAVSERLGPAATKVAQVAAGRGDLLPAALIAPLARLQDDARPGDLEALRRGLAAAYPEPLERQFEALDPRPVAAGAVAVVFKARLHGGQPVAVKLVRPGIARQMELDLGLMASGAAALGRLERLAHVPLVDTLHLFAEQVRRQCDMPLEAQFTERLGALLGPEIRVPAPLPELTRPGVLVTRWEDGGLRISDPALPREAYEKACWTLLRALYRMIFVHGLVHLDLHAGNVRVDHEGRVTLYDCGLMATLDERERRLFRDLMVSVATNDAAAASEHFVASATRVPPALDRQGLQEDMRALLQRHTGKPAGEFLVVRFVGELFDLQRRYGLHGTPAFANAVWALALFEGLVRERFPALDFQRELRPYVAAAFLDQMRAFQKTLSA